MKHLVVAKYGIKHKPAAQRFVNALQMLNMGFMTTRIVVESISTRGNHQITVRGKITTDQIDSVFYCLQRGWPWNQCNWGWTKFAPNATYIPKTHKGVK